ncbi:pyridoxamine 5'-phosphate oxidase family protein [Flavobacteriaceae bacterium S356]|uniref:Pyridoxamine 5'-phosphate oxidase family protein n=1 Tax=Asprobacillus argus TaxID=3076534 RepID=A0ABU3LF12_9FLAO|nr:pyridoxamine 5'-phosphate oxidase family protein [Flavobacteriaceae bacterium S356]
MKIDLTKDWIKVKTHFRKCIEANMHVVVASVDASNIPTVTPIGSMFLNDDQTGFYFEKYATKLNKNSKTNGHVCLLAVNNGKRFWLKSLFKGNFDAYPGIKLYGELGEKRDATEGEMRAFQRRVRYTKMLKGHQYLWKEMNMVREIKFTKAEKINLGKMTNHL